MDTKKWLKTGAIGLAAGALFLALATSAFAATSPVGGRFAQTCLNFMQGRGVGQVRGNANSQGNGAWCFGLSNGNNYSRGGAQNLAGTCMGGYYNAPQN